MLLPISAISVTDVFMLSASIRFFNTVIPRMSFQMTVLSIQLTQTRMCFLTHRGRGQERPTFSLVLQTLKFVPKGFTISQHRFTKWFVPTRRQTITWTKFDLASHERVSHSSSMCHGAKRLIFFRLVSHWWYLSLVCVGLWSYMLLQLLD